jgi:hypothetical protein
MRTDVAEHLVDVLGAGAVAAQEPMPPELPQVARSGHRLVGQLRHIADLRTVRSETQRAA